MQLTLKALTTNLIDDNWKPINTIKWQIKNKSLEAFCVIQSVVSVRFKGEANYRYSTSTFLHRLYVVK